MTEQTLLGWWCLEISFCNLTYTTQPKRDVMVFFQFRAHVSCIGHFEIFFLCILSKCFLYKLSLNFVMHTNIKTFAVRKIFKKKSLIQ